MAKIETYSSLAEFAQSRITQRQRRSPEEQAAHDRFDDEWALSSDVLTTVMTMVPGRYENNDFYLPTGYFWAHFKDTPKDQWPEIFASTRHLANNYSSAVNPSYKNTIIEIDFDDSEDILPLKMTPDQ